VKLPAPLEKDVLRSIKQYLEAAGCLVVRVNSGAMRGSHNGKRWFMRFTSEPGTSDLVCCVPVTIRAADGSRRVPGAGGQAGEEFAPDPGPAVLRGEGRTGRRDVAVRVLDRRGTGGAPGDGGATGSVSRTHSPTVSVGEQRSRSRSSERVTVYSTEHFAGQRFGRWSGGSENGRAG
jgi:hypothetical protein